MNLNLIFSGNSHKKNSQNCLNLCSFKSDNSVESYSVNNPTSIIKVDENKLFI